MGSFLDAILTTGYYHYRSILKQAGTNDEQQIKLIFNSIDTNGDGQLSMQELEDFALQLG